MICGVQLWFETLFSSHIRETIKNPHIHLN